MKLVGEPPYHLTSETHEIVSTFKKHEDNHDVVPKIDNEITSEGKDYDPVSAQQIGTENLVLSTDVRNAVTTDESQIDTQFVEAPLNLPDDDETILDDKDTEVYADKAVTQINDGESLIVKDICIDESSRFLIKHLVEEIDAAEMISSGMESCATSGNDGLSSLIKDGTPIVQNLNCKSVITENADHESSWCLPEVGEKPNIDEKTNIDISHQKTSLQQLFLLGDSDGAFDSSLPTIHEFSIDDEQISDQKNVKEVTLDELCSITTPPFTTTESIESSRVECFTKDMPDVSLEEECSRSTTVTSDSDHTVIDHSGTKEDSDITKLKNEVTSPELKSGEVESSCSKENTDSPQIVPVQTSVTLEPVHDSPKASARKLLYQDNHADMNLSGPHYLSGPKASSGHIAYSGNISMRSDSSTTSTRSFAFPILQSEWNTSPVKMAKAKRRHFRKHQWLRTGLLCCKF